MSWITTYTGKVFEFPMLIEENYKGYFDEYWVGGSDKFDIEDIAHALSMQCRFNGHTKDFYSVAQHSIVLSSLVGKVSPDLQLQALMHDAAETYVGDMITPLKKDMYLYRQVEDEILARIGKHFGFASYPIDPIVDDLDKQLGLTERYYLCKPTENSNIDPKTVLSPNTIFPFMYPLMDSSAAKRSFLSAFNKLRGEK